MKINEVGNLFEKDIDVSSIVTDDLKSIFKSFKSKGFDIKVAGGAVRDIMLGKKPKDVDLATTATPEQMKSVLAGWRTIDTGLEHGTITVLGKQNKNEEYEITTLRIDTNQDGRHADTEWTTDFKLDAARRDLTYNAMFADLDGTLHDFFGGEKDLKQGVTKSVGDPNERFQEDYLRILRMFRFSARYNHQLDQQHMDAIARNAKGLANISGERFWLEMQKILSTPNAHKAVQAMIHTGVDKMIGLNVTNFPGLKFADQGDPILTLAATIGHDNAQHLARRWKLRNEDRDRLLFITEHKPNIYTDKVMKVAIVNSKNPEWTKDRFLDVLAVQGKGSANGLRGWIIPVFPVQGRDLLQPGEKGSKEIGQKLRTLKDRWIDSNFTLSKEELLDG